MKFYLKRRKPTAKINAVLLSSRTGKSVLHDRNSNLTSMLFICTNADSTRSSERVNLCLKKLSSKFGIMLLVKTEMAQ